jgi:hypothetical protein
MEYQDVVSKANAVITTRLQALTGQSEVIPHEFAVKFRHDLFVRSSERIVVMVSFYGSICGSRTGGARHLSISVR